MQRDLAAIGAEVLHAELDAAIAKGHATADRWRAELADVEQQLAAVQAEFDAFPGNGLLSSELDELENVKERLEHQRWSLRGRIWLMVKPDGASNEPPEHWQP